jgi:hypothetical protein
MATKANTSKTASVGTVKPRAATPRTAASRKRTATATTPAAKKPTPKAATVSKPAIKPMKQPASPPVKAKTEPVPKEKVKKAKLVRDSFTMPEAEYAVLGEVKKACLKAGVEVKKSELLRVGVALIRKLGIGELKGILAGLPTLKAGRPKKSK